jgi:DNA-binding response OmpR family regulator
MARILLLEDSEDFRCLLQTRLEMEGFEVAAASSGADALRLMARAPADVILTDLFMPEKDGLETIVEMRARYPNTAIVAMSGWQSRKGVDYLTVARDIGAAHTVRKPFDLAEVVQVLRQLVSRAAESARRG